MGGIGEVIPVNAYIPGCPPRPEAIIHGVVALLDSLQNGSKPGPAPAPKPDTQPSTLVETVR